MLMRKMLDELHFVLIVFGLCRLQRGSYWNCQYLNESLIAMLGCGAGFVQMRANVGARSMLRSVTLSQVMASVDVL